MDRSKRETSAISDSQLDVPRQLDEIQAGLDELQAGIEGICERLNSVLRFAPEVEVNEEGKAKDIAPLAELLRAHNERIRFMNSRIDGLHKQLQI